MRDNDNMYIIILLVAILATAVIMFMIYLFSTKIGPTAEEYTVIPLIDPLDQSTSTSSISP